MRHALGAALLLVAIACGGSSGPVVEGVVIDVVGDLTTVESFTIRTTGGDDVVFTPADDVRFHGLGPLSHLRTHVATGSPVVVSYETAPDGSLIATEVDDR